MRTKNSGKQKILFSLYLSIRKVCLPCQLGISNSFWAQKSESILFNYHYRLVELNELRIFSVIIELYFFSGVQGSAENRFEFAKDKLKLKSETSKKNGVPEEPFTKENRLRDLMSKVKIFGN